MAGFPGAGIGSAAHPGMKVADGGPLASSSSLRLSCHWATVLIVPWTRGLLTGNSARRMKLQYNFTNENLNVKLLILDVINLKLVLNVTSHSTSFYLAFRFQRLTESLAAASAISSL